MMARAPVSQGPVKTFPKTGVVREYDEQLWVGTCQAFDALQASRAAGLSVRLAECRTHSNTQARELWMV